MILLIKPEWNHFMQHLFKDDGRNVSSFKLGFTLYYETKNPKKGDYKVGEEAVVLVELTV